MLFFSSGKISYFSYYGISLLNWKNCTSNGFTRSIFLYEWSWAYKHYKLDTMYPNNIRLRYFSICTHQAHFMGYTFTKSHFLKITLGNIGEKYAGKYRRKIRWNIGVFKKSYFIEVYSQGYRWYIYDTWGVLGPIWGLLKNRPIFFIMQKFLHI